MFFLKRANGTTKNLPQNTPLRGSCRTHTAAIASALQGCAL
jgi:hypothetical protein